MLAIILLTLLVGQAVRTAFPQAHQVEAVVADIKALLQNHPGVDNNQTLIVNFTRFGASPLDILVRPTRYPT